MGMHEGTAETATGEETGGLSRRGLFVSGGLLTAGIGALGAQGLATASAAGTATKIAVVTHGDTGSFWSVFKAGVDQAAKDMKGRGVNVTQVYANNDVSKQVSGINAAIASKVNVIATSVPDASALKDPLSKAAARGIEIITVNSGEGAFDALKTYEVHVGQDEEIAGEGAGKQFNDAGAKSVVVVIHEASNSGLTDRAKGVKKTFKGTTKTLLIPNAKADIPGTQAKIKAYFVANKGTDALLGLDPDVTVPAQAVAPSGTKVGTFDVNPAVITGIKGGKILFAIDQQQYLQGYLPVVFAVLFVTNLNTVGGGKPVLTGPGIINKANAAKVAALAGKGTR
jgi:simple sugar transport system substrate-binding protein